MSAQEEVPTELPPARDELGILHNQINKTEGSIWAINEQLAKMNAVLEKDSPSWTTGEKNQFGSHADLRGRLVQLEGRLVHLDGARTQLLSTRLVHLEERLNKEALQGALKELTDGPAPATRTTVVFLMKKKGEFTVSDLENNNIGPRNPKVATKFDMLKHFKAAISAKRIVKVSKENDLAIGSIKFLEKSTIADPWKLFDHIAAEYVEDDNNDEHEIRQYAWIYEEFKENNYLPDYLTKSALAIRLVIPVVDNSFRRDFKGYNRNKPLQYPINFIVDNDYGKNECFHIRPQLDIEIVRNEQYQLFVECNVEHGTPNFVFESDLIKAVTIARVIWESYQTSSAVVSGSTENENHHSFCCPFLLTSRYLFRLYIFYKDSGKFYYDLVETYSCANSWDMLRAAFHLRNLPVIQLDSSVTGNEIFKRKYLELQKSQGSLICSRKLKDFRNSNSARTDVVTELRDQILNEFYEIDEIPPGCEPAIPNCITATCRRSKSNVIIKNSWNQKEVYFLNKLSLPSSKEDRRNATVVPLEMLPSHDGTLTFIVFPLLNPLENAFGQPAQLSRQTWLDLIVQLTEYVAFLHEKRVCHRDIKPKNLAINMETMRLVVLDCDLMEEFSHAKNAIVTTYVGTKDYSLPAYVSRPERGFDPFELEKYSLKLTCDWMRSRARESSE